MPLYSPCAKLCGTPLDIDISVNTLWTGDTDLRLYITTVQDG